MGDPKKMKKHYENPKRPWEKTLFERERAIVKEYGIKRKKELRRLETIIRDLRRRARKLIASKDEKETKVLIDKAIKNGLIAKSAPVLDDVLEIELKDILERRLQTLVVKKGFANTTKQARQFIAHGHIAVNGQKIISPNYLVTVNEENSIMFRSSSSLNSTFQRAEESAPVQRKGADEKEKVTTVKEKLQDDKKEIKKEAIKKENTDGIKEAPEVKEQEAPKTAEKESLAETDIKSVN